MAEDRVAFEHDSYLVKKKILKMFGGVFYVHCPDGNMVLYSKMKAFKLKEDIRLFSGPDMKEEVLAIKARQVVDFSAAYDVVDSKSSEKVGALKRKGFGSLIQDQWILMDTDDQEIGYVKEDSTALALIRRFLSNLVPQTHNAYVGDKQVASYKQNFNPFTLRINVDFLPGTSKELDRRLGLATAILLAAVEGRQG